MSETEHGPFRPDSRSPVVSCPSIQAFALSPDGSAIVIGDYAGELSLWDTRSLAKIKVMAELKHIIHAVQFSRDGQYLACVTNDNQLRVYDIKNLRNVHVSEGKYDVGFSANGKLMAVLADNSIVHILEVGGFTKVTSLHGDARVALSPTGDTLATIHNGADDRAYQIAVVGDIAGGSGHALTTTQEWSRMVNALAFSPSGDYIACAIAEGSHSYDLKNYVAIWRVGNYKQPTNQLNYKAGGYSFFVTHVEFSNDSKHLLSSCNDGTITVWRCGTFEKIQTLAWEDAEISRFALSQRHLVAATQREFRVWTTE